MEMKNLSQEAIELVAERFKVLSEPIRLRLLNHLRTGEMTVGELTDACRSTQPNISKHLRILTDAGMLRRDQRGNTVYYSIADESIFKICDLVCDSLETRLRTRAEIFAAA
jgi:DNA-binding transcriptional ArsR family regulator